jgi:hypothetical protein
MALGRYCGPFLRARLGTNANSACLTFAGGGCRPDWARICHLVEVKRDWIICWAPNSQCFRRYVIVNKQDRSE